MKVNVTWWALHIWLRRLELKKRNKVGEKVDLSGNSGTAWYVVDDPQQAVASLSWSGDDTEKLDRSRRTARGYLCVQRTALLQ